METMNSTAKITQKGQVTLPKKIRQLLNTDIIEFEIIDDNLVLKPVQSVSGALSAYANKQMSFKSARDLAWEKQQFSVKHKK
jgi:AbrB family looped-hinge helix DNA binding protein